MQPGSHALLAGVPAANFPDRCPWGAIQRPRRTGKKYMAGKQKDKASIETTPETKRPGVIALIIESLTHAPEPGVSVVEMVERLAAATARDPAHLTNTVKTQL